MAVPDMLSIIIPARNEEKYLGPTLESVFAAIDRLPGGRRLVEVIVVDNISTDRTVECARSFPVRIVTEERRRIAAVRNRGAREARGRFLAFVDADSHPSPNAVLRIYRTLQSGRFAGGGVLIHPDRYVFGVLSAYVVLFVIRAFWGISAGMIFATAEAFHAVGGFDESLFAAEDLQFATALKKHALGRGLAFANLADVHIKTSTRKLEKASFADFLIFPRYLFDKESVRNLDNCRLWYSDENR